MDDGGAEPSAAAGRDCEKAAGAGALRAASGDGCFSEAWNANLGAGGGQHFGYGHFDRREPVATRRIERAGQYGGGRNGYARGGGTRAASRYRSCDPPGLGGRPRREGPRPPLPPRPATAPPTLDPTTPSP